MRFKDNNNGTITDTKTNLMWQKTTAPEVHDWSRAKDYCKSLRLAGHTNWRLPTLDELSSLVDRKRGNPAINPVFETVSSWHWSSSRYFNNPIYAWSVHFYDGAIYFDLQTSDSHIRAVRSIT